MLRVTGQPQAERDQRAAVDEHVVGDAGADGVIQAEADDTVIVRVERPGGAALIGPSHPGRELRGGTSRARLAGPTASGIDA
jgi:hypothetical protein